MIPLDLNDWNLRDLVAMIDRNASYFELIENPSQDVIAYCLHHDKINPEYVNLLEEDRVTLAIRNNLSLIQYLKNPSYDTLAYAMDIHREFRRGDTIWFQHESANQAFIKYMYDDLFFLKDIAKYLTEDMIDLVYEKVTRRMNAVIIYNKTKRPEIKTYLKMKFG